MFTVPVRITFWGLEEHKPLIIALFIPVFSIRNWRGPWTIKNIYWKYLTARAVDLECKREYEQSGHVQMKENLSQVSAEAIESIGDVMWIVLHRAREITSMSYTVVWRLLHIGS